MRLFGLNSKSKKLASVIVGSMVFGSFAAAQETESTVTTPAAQAPDEDMVEVYYNAETAYPKRPRVDLGGVEYVSPSQLHEVAGAHAAVGAQFKNVNMSQSGDDTRSQSLNVDARGMYGWNNFSAGLVVGYQDNNITPDNALGQSDTQRRALVAQPQLSATLNPNFTIGLMGRVFAENYALEGANDAQFASDRDADLTYGTATAGMSYHDEKQEYGVTYTTEAKASEDISETGETINIYRAPVATMFARGNLTDVFSVFGTTSYAFHERANEANQGRDIYDRFDLRDRIGAKLGGVFWTNERSKFALAGVYSGGTYAGPTGYEEEMGYAGLVNRYGVEADLNIRLQKDVSLSVRGGLTRGERSENFEGTQVSVREQRALVGTSVNVRM